MPPVSNLTNLTGSMKICRRIVRAKQALSKLPRSGPQIANQMQDRRFAMKYLFAWMLGIPGGLIVIWFVFNHMH